MPECNFKFYNLVNAKDKYWNKKLKLSDWSLKALVVQIYDNFSMFCAWFCFNEHNVNDLLGD